MTTPRRTRREIVVAAYCPIDDAEEMIELGRFPANPSGISKARRIMAIAEQLIADDPECNYCLAIFPATEYDRENSVEHDPTRPVPHDPHPRPRPEPPGSP